MQIQIEFENTKEWVSIYSLWKAFGSQEKGVTKNAYPITQFRIDRINQWKEHNNQDNAILELLKPIPESLEKKDMSKRSYDFLRPVSSPLRRTM
jgi:hypothetical protein